MRAFDFLFCELARAKRRFTVFEFHLARITHSIRIRVKRFVAGSGLKRRLEEAPATLSPVANKRDQDSLRGNRGWDEMETAMARSWPIIIQSGRSADLKGSNRLSNHCQCILGSMPNNTPKSKARLATCTVSKATCVWNVFIAAAAAQTCRT
jgi:hypothetical protein